MRGGSARGGRGGRGGRGARGGGDIRAFLTQTPLRAVDTFIYNPLCEETPELTQEEIKLVVWNRILRRHWNESEFSVTERPVKRIMETYSDRFEVDRKNPETQKRILVDSIGAEYFPSELLQQSFTRQSRHRVGDSKKAFSWADLEKREKSSAVANDDNAADSMDDAEDEVESDFGGQDYGQDYDDEDREDDFNDDNGKGGDD